MGKAEYCIRKFTTSCLAILLVVPFLISSMLSLSLSTNGSRDLDRSFFVAVSVSCTDSGDDGVWCRRLMSIFLACLDPVLF